MRRVLEHRDSRCVEEHHIRRVRSGGDRRPDVAAQVLDVREVDLGVGGNGPEGAPTPSLSRIASGTTPNGAQTSPPTPFTASDARSASSLTWRQLTADAAGRDVADQSWFCLLHQHGYVTMHDNRDDWRATSHLCTRCGHIKDDWRGAGPAPASLAWASFSRGDS